MFRKVGGMFAFLGTRTVIVHENSVRTEHKNLLCKILFANQAKLKMSTEKDKREHQIKVGKKL